MEFNFNNNEFSVKSNGYTILEHTAKKPFLYVGKGAEEVEMYRGNFKIEDYVIERSPLAVSQIEKNGASHEITFADQLKMVVSVENGVCTIDFTQLNQELNRVWFRVSSEAEEKLFGLGEQMSYLNLKGRNFPIFTSEPGVGRDKSTYVTWRSDVENKAGGDYYNSNFPQPTYVSSHHYYLHLESTAYSEFNFKNEAFSEVEVWEVPTQIRIEDGMNYIEILEKLTAFLGRQPELPDWIYNGLMLGLQGGNERVDDLLAKTLAEDIKVSSLWCQDWCGKRVTSFGKRLQWDWKFHTEMYPDLPKKIEEFHARGIKFLGYINPYLVNDGVLYQEGLEKGYFAKKSDGSEYLVDFGEFDCGVVDLTNPDAYNWFKDEVIIKHSINIGIDGWMADFGEYLPTDDIVLHSGKSPMIEHNNWPVLWAKCNYDAVSETNNIGNIMYFMRAGGARTGKYCTLLWAGDQSVDFTVHDGLASVICGALSAGMSGMGISHSDIGGYTSLFDNTRNKELFLRWSEMAVFTPVMRTHEGNRPDTNFQYYDDVDCMKQLSRLVDVYTMLKPYIKGLVKENADKGTPVQRPMFLHHESDPEAYTHQYQYLLGEDILVAPVYTEATTEWDVYLPAGEWVHIWSGKTFTQGTHTIPAEIGMPPAYYKKSSVHSELFASITEKHGKK